MHYWRHVKAAIASNVILDCGYYASASNLYEELKKRFNITDQNVIQAKLAAFNLLIVKSGKTVDFEGLSGI